MSIPELTRVLQNEYSPVDFLDLAGNLAADKLSSFVEETIDFSASIAEVHPKIYRGSAKGVEAIGIYAVEIHQSTLKTGFKKRRQIANAIININDHNDALIAFYSPEASTWRLGFVRGYKYDSLETLREFHVGQKIAIRTAKEQLSKAYNLPNTTELGERSVKLNEAFSVESVSDNFYKQFKLDHFDAIVSKLIDQGESKKNAEDLTVLFTIRIMFLGFVQKKGWLDDDQNFLQNLLKVYGQQLNHSGFYEHWLKTLFFNALNGFSNNINGKDLPDQIRSTFKMLPYLNGGLFQEHEVDKCKYAIPDEQIQNFFAFLFSYNFTIEENTLHEQSLELNPELLGVIFERLVNKANGAIYTPRTEVDFMCRMSLIKWLQQNLGGDNTPEDRDLFELFFREKDGSKVFDDDQKRDSLSITQKQEIIVKLKTLAICDPAVGSGAFPVGMMHVLNEVCESLGDDNSDQARYERKKRIIRRSLYGVEANEWAVWICQLRLWLSLFIDAPDELRRSFTPILPSLDFKILHGDSIVQMIGDTIIPIEGHAAIDSSSKKKVTELRKLKADFFNNQLPDSVSLNMILGAEVSLAKAIIIEQRNEKFSELQILRQKEMVTQQSLLGENPDKIVQQALGDADEQAYLTEISRMDKMLGALTNRPKTIWSISFAEVFADKGGFDIVIGNPPYVRQEDISDPLSLIPDQQAYKQKLAEVVNLDYWPTKNFNMFKRISGLNAQSDLYIYFYLHSLKLLNQGGIHAFICSNSWLDVGYGVWLQQFLLNKVQVHAIYDNHARRSFSGADVNTIITIMNAPSKTPKQSYKFVAFKRPFEEAIITENLLAIERVHGVQKRDVFRVYTVLPQKLLSEGTEDNKFIGGKWGGMYLRAPEILFTIIEKADRKLKKLKDLADAVPGCYSGINDFFYINEATVDKYHIESEYLLPLLRNTRSISSLNFVNNKQDYVLAIPAMPKNQLGPNVERYIRWGESRTTRERQKTKAGIPWPKTATASSRKYWYSIPEKNLLPTKIFMQYVVGEKFCAPYSNKVIVSDRCYHRIFAHSNIDELALTASLNSTLTFLFVMIGRSGLGQGALKFETTDAKMLKIFYPDSDQTLERMKELLPDLGKRLPKSIFIECGIDPESKVPIEEQEPKPLPDRAALDEVIFNDLGLSEKERKEVYRAVCQLVYNRLTKAQSV